MRETSVIVKLRSMKLTNNISLEEIACLDRGMNLINGELPLKKDGDPAYAIYYRTTIDNHRFGDQEMTDWAGSISDEMKIVFDLYSKKYE